jgi:hypothetical protein
VSRRVERSLATMTIKRVVGFVGVLSGALIVTLGAATVLAGLYYRPTLEGPTSGWLTGEVFSSFLGMLLGTMGGLFIWGGVRWVRS